MKKLEGKNYKWSLLLLTSLLLFNFSSFSNSTFYLPKNKIQQQREDEVISKFDHKQSNSPFKNSESEDIEIEEEIEDNELEDYTFSTAFFHFSSFESDYFLSKVANYKNTSEGFQKVPLYKLFHNWKTYLS
jgi:hypothetical protein